MSRPVVTLQDKRFENIVTQYRERVLGKTCQKGAPAEYWEVKLATELKLSPSQWRELSLEDRARIMAANYLENMVKTIDRHYEEQEANKKKNREDLRAGNMESADG